MKFDQNGHLTDAGIAALRDGLLSPEETLTVAEHIGSCPVCAALFAGSFTEGALPAVPRGFSEMVLRKADIREADRKKQLFFYSLRVSFAACIAIAILCSGAFSRLANSAMTKPIQPPDIQFVDNINVSLQDFSQRLLNLEVFSHEKEKK